MFNGVSLNINAGKENSVAKIFSDAAVANHASANARDDAATSPDDAAETISVAANQKSVAAESFGYITFPVGCIAESFGTITFRVGCISARRGCLASPEIERVLSRRFISAHLIYTLPSTAPPMQKTLFPPKKTKSQNPFVQPFLKWAGGKRQLLPVIRPLLPARIKRYYEPFLGGGAVFFDVMPKNAVVNDSNLELINCYMVIRDQPEELLESFLGYTDDDNFFYYMRDLEDSTEFEELSSNPVQRASRILYLNGMALKHAVQIDREGNSTVPYDGFHYDGFADSAIIRAVSHFLNRDTIEISSQDYAQSVESARKGDFVYFDPPHDFVSNSASFTGYNLNGFGRDEQKRLKMVCDELTAKGVKWLLSNSDTKFIRKLYSADNYFIRQIDAYYIEDDVMGLGDVDILGELVISNYELPQL